jgi:hypothetical protein
MMALTGCLLPLRNPLISSGGTFLGIAVLSTRPGGGSRSAGRGVRPVVI